ncbi:MAG: ATP-binding protein [Cyanobacteria bacterium P01_D01_bin.50]
MKCHFYSKLSLRHQITIPFITVVISLLFTGSYSVGYFLTINLAERKIESLEKISSLILRTFEKEANSLKLNASLIADTPGIRETVINGDKSTLLRNILSIKSTLELDFVRVVDRNGQIIVNLQERQLASSKFKNEKVLRQVLNGVYLSTILSAKRRSQSVLVGFAPIKSKKGVVGGVILGTTISDHLLKQIRKGKNEQIVAFSQGEIIASTLDITEDEFGQIPIENTPPIVITLASESYLAKSISISGFNNSILNLVLLKSLVPLEKAQQNLWTAIILFTLLGALIAIFIGSFIAKIITERIQNLTLATKRLARGDFSTAINVDGNDEITTLAQGFNLMTEQLTERDRKIRFQLEELENKNEQLKQTLQKLQEAQNQIIAQEKLASLGSLTAGIAHEINTPIGIGVTAASILEEKTKSLLQSYENGEMKRSELKKYLDSAVQSSQMLLGNLNRAIELIQSFKQVAVDQSSEERRIFNVKEYLNGILLQLQPKLKITKHKIEIQGSNYLIIDSYPGGFSQIITNLIINSLMHAYEESERGNIIIKYRREEENFILEYQDNGKGIPPDNINKIFEPFFTTKRNQGGTGLGLHVIYNIVTQKLLGSINCESTLGIGTKFMIQFPMKSP